MSKVRVHELAKQLGMESKVVLAKLQEMGEFVRSASSTVEAPVVRKLIEMYPDAKPVEEKKPVKKAAAKKAAVKALARLQAQTSGRSSYRLHPGTWGGCPVDILGSPGVQCGGCLVPLESMGKQHGSTLYWLALCSLYWLPNEVKLWRGRKNGNTDTR